MEMLPIFAERLMLARHRACMSQKKVAHALGVHTSNMSKMERGQILPNALRLLRLARLLKVSADFLLGNDKA